MHTIPWRGNIQAQGMFRSSKYYGINEYATTQNKKRTAVIPGYSELLTNNCRGMQTIQGLTSINAAWMWNRSYKGNIQKSQGTSEGWKKTHIWNTMMSEHHYTWKQMYQE